MSLSNELGDTPKADATSKNRVMDMLPFPDSTLAKKRKESPEPSESSLRVIDLLSLKDLILLPISSKADPMNGNIMHVTQNGMH